MVLGGLTEKLKFTIIIRVRQLLTFPIGLKLEVLIISL